MDDYTDGLVAKFCSITDTDTSTASRLLAKSGNDLEAALAAFYDGGGVAQEEVREPIAPIKNVLVEDSPSNGFFGFKSHSGKENKLLYSSESGESRSCSSGSLTGGFGSLRLDTTEILKESLFFYSLHLCYCSFMFCFPFKQMELKMFVTHKKCRNLG